MRELLPPRKRRKIDCRPSGSSQAPEENVDEASHEEIQSDDDSTHQHCVCVSVLNAEKEVLKCKNAKLSDKCVRHWYSRWTIMFTDCAPRLILLTRTRAYNRYKTTGIVTT